MRTVIFSWSGGIEKLIIFCHKCLPSFRITEYPVLKCLPYCFLLLACNHGFLFIEDSLFLSILLNGVIYSRIFEVQGIFQYLIGIYPACTVCHVDKRIAIVRIFALYIPLSGYTRKLHIYRIPAE